MMNISFRRMPGAILLALAFATAGTREAAAGIDPPYVKTEHVYKEVEELQIKADVYRPQDTETRPVVVWYHGEGLVRGNRDKPLKELLQYCERRGYILVSFDYRLAPEVKLSEILKDVRDGITWIREKGPALFRANAARIVATGESSGGYLALAAGMIMKQPLTAIVSYWGYGDVDGEWYTEPSEFHCVHYKPVSKTEALNIVGKKVLCRTTWGEGGMQRDTYYIYLRQTGSWPKEVTGVDPEKRPDLLRRFSPLRSMDSSFPPTLLIHGTDDEDVPFSRSAEMAQALADSGVPHKLIRIENGLRRLAGGDKEQVAKGREQIFEFITMHLEK